MRKKIYIVLIGILIICAIWTAIYPYKINSPGTTYTPDIVFEKKTDVEEVLIDFDYSSGIEEESNDLLGKIGIDYNLTDFQATKAILPFFGSISQNSSNRTSVKERNVIITADGEPISYEVIYGDACPINHDSLNGMDYQALCEQNHKDIVPGNDDNYYIYLYNLKDTQLCISKDIIEKECLYVSNMQNVKVPFWQKNKFAKEHENQVVLERTKPGTSIIIAKTDLDAYLSNVNEKIIAETSWECYEKLFKKLYKNIDITGAIYAAHYEIDMLFSYMKGIAYRDLDDFINCNRYMLYCFDLPNCSTLNISYNILAGKNTVFEHPQYETSFELRKENYTNVKKFNVIYHFDEENKFINFSPNELIVSGQEAKLSLNTCPKEIKAFFSSTDTPKKTFDFLKMEISGYFMYIIMPLIFIVFLISFITEFFDIIKKQTGLSKINVLNKFINYVVAHIPHMLAFYLVGFKFITLYKNDSGINELNVCLTLAFLVLCGIYFICFNLKEIKYGHLIFYSVLSVCATLLCKDVAFVLLVALAVCFAKLGPKQYLKAFCFSIAFFFVLTITLSGYGILENTLVKLWGGPEDVFRSTFGFTHPNTVSLFLFIFIAALISYKKVSSLAQIGLLLITSIIYYTTHSRTGCFGIIILIAANIFADLVHLKGKWRYVFVLAFPALFLFTYGMIIKYGAEPNKLNSLLSNRLSIMNGYIKEEQWINLRGIPVRDPVNSPIDNLYMNVFILQGWPCFCIYTIIYMLASYKIIKSKNTNMLVVLISYFIYSLFEATLMSYSCAFIVAILFISEISKKYDIDGNLKLKVSDSNGNNLY